VIVTDAQRIGPWVCERAGGTWVSGRGSAIGIEKDGELVAGVLFEDFNHANVLMHVAGKGKYWLNREFLWFSFYYPFEQLRVKRITVVIPSSNKESLRFAKHLGFVPEATLEDAHPDGNLEILVMRRNQCRWLEIRK